jgi:hypothetical protein
VAPSLDREAKRRTRLIVGAFFLIVVVVALFAWRPATVVGVDGQALHASVTGLEGDCESLENDLWLCTTNDPMSSEGGAHTVEMQSFGCWHAWNGDRVVGDRPPTDSGCITVVDLF